VRMYSLMDTSCGCVCGMGSQVSCIEMNAAWLVNDLHVYSLTYLFCRGVGG